MRLVNPLELGKSNLKNKTFENNFNFGKIVKKVEICGELIFFFLPRLGNGPISTRREARRKPLSKSTYLRLVQGLGIIAITEISLCHITNKIYFWNITYHLISDTDSNELMILIFCDNDKNCKYNR